MNMESESNMISPFVMKTYEMVSDPTTNGLIAWGRANNSFIVMEPLDFSQRILPLYFKHNNFSSFVRQLNTYSFRKVDPDRWEFANEWFLRGQTQLLNKIVRRKKTSRSSTSLVIKHKEEEDDDDELVMEMAKLKHEQQSLEQELDSMNRRLEATERRPQQIMTFLWKVVQDPHFLLNKENVYDSYSKKKEIMISAASLSSSLGMPVSSSSAKSEENLNDGKLNVDSCLQSAPVSPDESEGMAMIRQEHHGFVTLSSSSLIGPSAGGIKGYDTGRGGDCSSYFEALVAGEKARQQPAPYPFSLLDGGF